eukprot:m.58018 g.58018  ORF g.58018 m.58018 type:complete len:567 (+) comp12808_c0_seq1:115-1815(+)
MLMRAALQGVGVGRWTAAAALATHRRALSTASERRLFLGLDSSTQGLKASVVNEHLDTVFTTALNYDRDLPEYKTSGGVHHGDELAVSTPTVMLFHALDVVLGRLGAETGVPLEAIAAVSGSGQQHGSVYWKSGAKSMLADLNPAEPLRNQLSSAFSTPDSPIWMDSSTRKQCLQLEDSLGGPQRLADITGSRAYERFTALQIMKKFQTTPDVYNNTERISLISSAMCCALLGDYASIDTSDGAGMNLMDLQAQEWSQEVLDSVAPDLGAKLGAVVPAHTVLGNISSYFVERYGFNPDCRVVAWSGDNPNSVAGLGLREPGDVAISLGTSDTIFSIMDADASTPGLEGHVFVNPVDPASHMAMLCYKNGSLARESVAKRVAGGSWEAFGELLAATPAGNGGNIGFFIQEPEIIPFIPTTGVRRFGADGRAVDSFPPEVEARAVLEGQFLSMRLHGQQLGLEPKAIIATGGASANRNITQVISNVFGTPVKIASQPDSASLGAAYRALHGLVVEEAGTMVPFAQATQGGPAAHYQTVAEPDLEATARYTGMLDAYKELEQSIVAAEQ